MKQWLGSTKPDTGRFGVVIVEVQPEPQPANLAWFD